ncbi:MAG: replication factor C small subunit [Edafosvirus sp.]|uniref:Replication factor C small subunit n=1 Tax=Edafosvirus sp. TaxID=2487765 RepID=A0A3G4ZTR4_9VIRU|nr:MAG: replication factor C small subunit [Edafosvirus sp.]
MKKHIQTPWIEKYRPKTINELVADENTLHKIKKIINEKDMPNIIITGNPGIGKTTTILCIARGLFGNNMEQGVLELNASDDRGSKVVQDKMIIFCKKKLHLNKKIIENKENKNNGCKDGNKDSDNDSDDDKQDNEECEEKQFADHKIIILDEADNMTSKAQRLINNLMEKYHKTTRFAFTCNKSSDILEAIQSRCIILRYYRLSNDQVVKRLEEICALENITYDKEALYTIASNAQGDMRHAINSLQLTYNGFVNVTIDNVNKICDRPQPYTIKKIFESIYKKDHREALKLLMNLKEKGYSGSDITLSMINTLKLANYIEFDEKTKIMFMDKISRAAYIISKGIDTDLQLIGCVCSLLELN